METSNTCNNELETGSKPTPELSKAWLEEIKFKWSQDISHFGDKLLLRLKEFQKNDLLNDVTLKTLDGELKAHKIVLAACGGIFRSKFIDDKESNPTEISLDCHSVGMKSILNFAYSGCLEITSDNLFSLLLAAIATEMKEIKEICSTITINKFDWMLSFDGTQETLSNADSNVTGSFPSTLDDAFNVLHYILNSNLQNFKSELHTIDDSTLTDNNTYPSFKPIAEKWPDLKNVYLGMMNCLIESKKVCKSLKLPTKTSPKILADHKKEIEKESNSSSSLTLKEKQITNNEIKEEPATELVNEKAKSPSSTGNHVEQKEAHKSIPSSPESPRLLEVSIESPDEEKQPEIKSASSPVSRPDSQSASALSAVSSPQSLAPSPPIRRRHSSNKPPPPAIPPLPIIKKNSKPLNTQAHPNPKQENVKSPTKIPPPRPKPPSFNKKKKEENAAKYNDTLNPFLST